MWANTPNPREEVKAANNTGIKNTVPITPPIGIPLNTFGKVMNINPGPALSADLSPPENAKTPGITMSPARKAMPVSNSSI